MFLFVELFLFPSVEVIYWVIFPCKSIHRSSYPEVFYKKGVLKNLTKFTGKHLCQSLFFNNVAGLQLD